MKDLLTEKTEELKQWMTKEVKDDGDKTRQDIAKVREEIAQLRAEIHSRREGH